MKLTKIIEDKADLYRANLEKKYYPITWKIHDDKLKMYFRNGKRIPDKHEVYRREENFIYEHIENHREFSGEVACP
jgi:hypothetical protein|tara:strand:- start:674 stop:901 length:228 start_codon:yes stop_codon:yes gene_type:complete